jgi:hypothetical protein
MTLNESTLKTQYDCLMGIWEKKFALFSHFRHLSLASSIEIKFEVIFFQLHEYLIASDASYIFNEIFSHEHILCRCLYFIFLTHLPGCCEAG